MHDDDVGVRGGEPAYELVLVRDIGTEVATVALVIAVVADAAALRGECANHVEVGFAGCDELVPEEGTPAALGRISMEEIGGVVGGGWACEWVG